MLHSSIFCKKQGITWHSGDYWVQIHSKHVCDMINVYNHIFCNHIYNFTWKRPILFHYLRLFRTRHLEVLKGKGVTEICSKFKGEHPCWSDISIKLLCNFIKIILQHECFPVNLLHIFRILFRKNTSGWLLQIIQD